MQVDAQVAELLDELVGQVEIASLLGEMTKQVDKNSELEEIMDIEQEQQPFGSEAVLSNDNLVPSLNDELKEQEKDSHDCLVIGMREIDFLISKQVRKSNSSDDLLDVSDSDAIVPGSGAEVEQDSDASVQSESSGEWCSEKEGFVKRLNHPVCVELMESIVHMELVLDEIAQPTPAELEQNMSLSSSGDGDDFPEDLAVARENYSLMKQKLRQYERAFNELRPINNQLL